MATKLCICFLQNCRLVMHQWPSQQMHFLRSYFVSVNKLCTIFHHFFPKVPAIGSNLLTNNQYVFSHLFVTWLPSVHATQTLAYCAVDTRVLVWRSFYVCTYVWAADNLMLTTSWLTRAKVWQSNQARLINGRTLSVDPWRNWSSTVLETSEGITNLKA